MIKEITTYNESIIESVDGLIRDAIADHITDIHIEPYATSNRIRFRRDGLLYEAASIPTALFAQVCTRLKIMGNLNIAEKRLPQDGHIHFHHENKIDIRINTCPTLFGEKIVLRLMNITQINLEIDALGFNKQQKNIFLNKLSQPQGLILVTGPTGSGKTITLYSALQYLNHIEKNIISIEDPVEIELSGINQVNINPIIGLNFASALRTLLRQDPDVIMIGEIRDGETATIAMQAAQTGHLVLATLHTNNAAETIARLKAMGIEIAQFVDAISLIIGQRLIRKLCYYCKQQQKISRLPNTHTHYQAVGCDRCYHGYAGRIGIFELLPVTKKISQCILSEPKINYLGNIAKKEGYISLQEAGLEKVSDGVTNLEELQRVIGWEINF